MTSPQGVAESGQWEMLFEACDRDRSGYIEKAELFDLCSDLDLTQVEFDDIFKELDTDGDGKISRSDFRLGFASVSSLFSRRKTPLTSPEGSREHLERPVKAAEAWESFKVVLELDYYLISPASQEHVCELYQSIHNSELPHLTALFENVVLAVVRDIKHHQYENERLERSYKRDKDQHSRHLRQLEEEMEMQMSKVESRVKLEDRERYEAEKEELRTELEGEIFELTKNIKKLQKMEEQMAASTTPAEELKHRHRIDELLSENRQLRSSVTESTTNLALARSECTTSRQKLEEKCYELQSEKSSLVDYIHEQDSLLRQVHLLQEANKKLHDTNDDLRSALDTSRVTQKRWYSGGGTRGSQFPKADFVSDYIDSARSMHMRNRLVGGATLADELSMTRDVRGLHMLPAQESCEIDSLPDDFDSGHSTLRDVRDLDSDHEPNSISDDSRLPRRHKRNCMLTRSEFGSTTESEMQSESQDEMETEVDQEEDEDECDVHCSSSASGCLSPFDSRDNLRSGSRTSGCSRASTCSCGSRESRKRQRAARRKLTVVNLPKPITKAPERMYKVVLAGDASVGKSSFIMRLCKGKFVNNISSTLGVDFQTKIVEVDGRVVALQLWDTAGQERFRSIAKSYFRRADGVLLLYDCTYERSFLNVRDWIDAIEEGAGKRIPTMFCANKTDLRDEIEANADVNSKTTRLVKREDGQRLAKENEGLFIETSAKDNTNILEAVTELARMLRTNEDIEVKTVGLQLEDLKVQPAKKTFSCCGT